MEAKNTDNSFKFISYKVVESSIKLNIDKELSSDFTIRITPSGEKKSNKFLLKLDVHVTDKNGSYNVYVSMAGEFEFKEDIENIPDFFSVNAPAILFPYVRAYVSSLTSVSGIDTVIIPTLNLTPLKKELEQNIVVVE